VAARGRECVAAKEKGEAVPVAAELVQGAGGVAGVATQDRIGDLLGVN